MSIENVNFPLSQQVCWNLFPFSCKKTRERVKDRFIVARLRNFFIGGLITDKMCAENSQKKSGNLGAFQVCTPAVVHTVYCTAYNGGVT